MPDYLCGGESPGTADAVHIEPVGTIGAGQDGAICGDLLFRFGTRGKGHVYRADTWERVGAVTLGGREVFSPHSNAVCFGTERYAPDDPFPLLYTNAYNNYAEAADRKEGTCGVYRILPDGGDYVGEPVQLVRVGFTDDPLWRSQNGQDVRPYGNMIVDTDTGSLYAFTMRDEEQTTRFFRFDLPKASDGEPDGALGVRTVTLGKENVLEYFDCPYSHFLQGAAYWNGRIYSTEGFSDGVNRPLIRVIDLRLRRQTAAADVYSYGLTQEAEFIDVSARGILYGDSVGSLFRITFKEETADRSGPDGD